MKGQAILRAAALLLAVCAAAIPAAGSELREPSDAPVPSNGGYQVFG